MGEDKCKSCGQAAVEEDEGNVVCTACGHVQEDGTSFQFDRNLEGTGQACHSGSSYNQTFGKGNYRLCDKSVARDVRLQKWIQCSNKICERMQVRSKEMQKEAANILTNAYKIDHFKNMRSESKEALCGACVYVMCRRHDLPILITNLMKAIDISDDTLLKQMSYQLINALKIDITSPSLEEFVPTCLTEWGVTDKALRAKTLDVIELAVELSYEEGRRKDSLVYAACCIAWQATLRKTHQFPLSEFGKTVLKRPVPNRGYKRYKELINAIKTMAPKVPWIPAAMVSKKDSWMYYLDDILKYKKTLISRVESPQGNDDDDDDDDGESVGCSVLAHPAFCRSHRKRALEGDVDTCEQDCKVSKSGHLTSESMNCPELSEKDIPDSELCLYIKTAEEIKLAKELQLVADS